MLNVNNYVIDISSNVFVKYLMPFDLKRIILENYQKQLAHITVFVYESCIRDSANYHHIRDYFRACFWVIPYSYCHVAKL